MIDWFAVNAQYFTQNLDNLKSMVGKGPFIAKKMNVDSKSHNHRNKNPIQIDFVIQELVMNNPKKNDSPVLCYTKQFLDERESKTKN